MSSASSGNPCQAVRRTCEEVMRHARHVSINQEAIQKAAEDLAQFGADRFVDPVAFDFGIHLSADENLTVQYLLVVDALNFCFWSDDDLEYEHLASGLKEKALKDPQSLSATRLSTIQGGDIQQLLNWSRPLPQQEERARLLREVGTVLLEKFEGEAANLVRAADKSAAKLVGLVTASFPGFRDHCMYRGQQVFFYKRAQIFVGDLYGAFQGKGLGEFSDIDQLTMFADYRVPVVLRNMGILQYTDSLNQKIEEETEITPGAEEEVEIRAASIAAVEQLRVTLQQQIQAPAKSALIDWCLWELGEKKRTVQKHHRTWTIYY